MNSKQQSLRGDSFPWRRLCSRMLSLASARRASVMAAGKKDALHQPQASGSFSRRLEMNRMPESESNPAFSSVPGVFLLAGAMMAGMAAVFVPVDAAAKGKIPPLVEPGPGSVTSGYERFGPETGYGKCRAEMVVNGTPAGQTVYTGDLKKDPVQGKPGTFNGYYGEKTVNGSTTRYLCFSRVYWKKKPGSGSKGNGSQGNRGKFDGMAR